jgi:hypothetical protein
MSRDGVVFLTAASAGVGLDEVTTLMADKARCAKVVDVRQSSARRIRTSHDADSRVTRLGANPGVLGDLHRVYDHAANGNAVIVLRPSLFETFAAWLSECGGPEIFADLDLDLRAGVLAARGRDHNARAQRYARRIDELLPLSRSAFVIHNDVHGLAPRCSRSGRTFDPTRRARDGQLEIPYPGSQVLQNAIEANVGLSQAAALGETSLKTWSPETVNDLLRWGRAAETALTPLMPSAWRATNSDSSPLVKAPSPDLTRRVRARRRAFKLQQLNGLLHDPDVVEAIWDAGTALVRRAARRLRRRLRAYLRAWAMARIQR